MKKSIVTIIISMASAILILVTGAKTTECFFPPAAVPASISDSKEIARYLFANASLGYLMGRVIAGMIAGFFIGAIASKMKVKKGLVVFVAALFTTLCLFYMYLAVHPVWFWLMLSGSFIPCSLIGYKPDIRITKSKSGI